MLSEQNLALKYINKYVWSYLFNFCVVAGQTSDYIVVFENIKFLNALTTEIEGNLGKDCKSAKLDLQSRRIKMV